MTRPPLAAEETTIDIVIPARVLRMRGYGASRVFAALASAGALTRFVPTTIVDLARTAGVHRNTARTALRRLAATGFATEKPTRPGYWRLYMTPRTTQGK